MKNHDKKIPFAYLLTLRTYGTWLHGDSRSSVDPYHNIYGTPRIKPNAGLHEAMKKGCTEDEFLMNFQQRETVLRSLIGTCEYNTWYLHAAHVRTNHLHAVLRADTAGRKTITQIKIYATKALKTNHPEILTRKNFWSEGGSAVNIWAPEYLFSAMNYVIERQGEKMAFYYEKDYEKRFCYDW